MTTLQSPRRCKSQRQQSHEAARKSGHAAWRRRDEAERLAAPHISLGPVPGDLRHRITIESAGVVTIIEAREPTCAARSDQMAVTIDGAPCDKLHGITALLALVGRYLPRQPSRQAVRDAEIAAAWSAAQNSLRTSP